MAYNLPDIPVTGTVIETAWGLAARDSLAATAPAVVTTRGDMVRASALNAIERVGLTVGGVWIGGASDPQWLAAGTEGQVLEMGASLPAWASLAGWTEVASGTGAAGSIAITGIGSSYRELMLVLTSGHTSNQQMTMTWNSLSSQFHYHGWHQATAGASPTGLGTASAASIPITQASLDNVSVWMHWVQDGTRFTRCMINSVGDEDDGSGTDYRTQHLFAGNGHATNGIAKVSRIDLTATGRTTTYTLMGLA